MEKGQSGSSLAYDEDSAYSDVRVVSHMQFLCFGVPECTSGALTCWKYFILCCCLFLHYSIYSISIGHAFAENWKHTKNKLRFPPSRVSQAFPICNSLISTRWRPVTCAKFLAFSVPHVSSSVSASPGKEKEGANTTGWEEVSSPPPPLRPSGYWACCTHGLLLCSPGVLLRSHHLAREMTPLNPDQRRIMGNLAESFLHLGWNGWNQRDSALLGTPGSPGDPQASFVAILPRKWVMLKWTNLAPMLKSLSVFQSVRAFSKSFTMEWRCWPWPNLYWQGHALEN